MCCCGKKPSVKLYKQVVYSTSTVWNDKKCPGTGGVVRQMQWRFYRNGIFVFHTAFAAPTVPLPIGTGSTYELLNATPAEIATYLLSQGVVLYSGDIVEIDVKVRNCDREEAVSNKQRILVALSECDCIYAFEYATNVTGNSVTLPGIFSTELFAFQNGALNYAGNDFSANPLVATDELMFVTLTNCTSTLAQEIVTGVTGNVPIPLDFQGLQPTQYALFRNQVAQRGHIHIGNEVQPADDPSAAYDEWLFARIGDPLEECNLNTVNIGTLVSGSSITLPNGYNSENQERWILFRNGVAQYPNPTSFNGYSVNSSGSLTPNTAFFADNLWLLVIP
jgi:hypothetical protein